MCKWESVLATWKVIKITDNRRFFYYIGWLSFLILCIYVFMKLFVLFGNGMNYEVGLAEWMVTGYICAIIPIIATVVFIPRMMIFFGLIQSHFKRSNKPLVFAFDQKKDLE